MRQPLTISGIGAADVRVVRGERLMLDSRVAEAFGTETRQVNQAVARNQDKFTEAHCFVLSGEEFDHFRSQAATTKTGRGGRRTAPRVFTVKGVARLATILNTPAALAATDLIIDTFLLVQEQLAKGKRTISVPEPDRYSVDDEDRATVKKLRQRLAAAVNRLLDTMVDPEKEQTLGEASKAISAKALHNEQERLRTKGLENAKLEADFAPGAGAGGKGAGGGAQGQGRGSAEIQIEVTGTTAPRRRHAVHGDRAVPQSGRQGRLSSVPRARADGA